MAGGMQFPYPRKTSDSTNSYPALRSSSYSRRRGLKALAPYILGGVGFIWFILWLFGSPATSSTSLAAPAGTPEVIIVTPIDPHMSEKQKALIKENREDYAKRHGYATFFPTTTDYYLNPGVPATWSAVPALRHAMSKYPYTPWIWHLTATALIMEPGKNLYDHILEPRKLESKLIVDQPVVPPDSVIKTFSHLKGERVHLIMTQDKDGLATGSMLIRTGDWAKYFLDAWFDPLYRSYNFQKAERHALEHMVQWHGTVLAKMGLVSPHIMNSYMPGAPALPEAGSYADGDLIVNCFGCAADATRSCDHEMSSFASQWREKIKKL